MSIAVLGAGSWGTALALLLHKNGREVTLWSWKEEQVKAIKANGENKDFLPGVAVPEDLPITSNLEEAVSGRNFVVLSVPSQSIREVAHRIFPMVLKTTSIISTAKGLEKGTLLRLSQVIHEELPHNKIAVLSGPSHAEEVARELPTTIVASSEDMELAKEVQNIFMSKFFRVYTNDDLLGVELAGALKNIIALAAGISDGLGYGDNSRAALITRGLTEITRLGLSMGAKQNTFAGLAGLGDLVVTCNSRFSRNWQAGYRLGQGKKIEEVLSGTKMVVEGVSATAAACALAKKQNVQMPISSQLYKILFEDEPADKALLALMERDKADEVNLL